MTNEERALKLAMQIERIGILDCGHDDCMACPEHRKDAIALVIAFADEIRAQAAEKAVAWYQEEMGGPWSLDEARLRAAITGKEPTK